MLEPLAIGNCTLKAENSEDPPEATDPTATATGVVIEEVAATEDSREAVVAPEGTTTEDNSELHSTNTVLNFYRCYSLKEPNTGKRRKDVSVRWPREGRRSLSVHSH